MPLTQVVAPGGMLPIAHFIYSTPVFSEIAEHLSYKCTLFLENKNLGSRPDPQLWQESDSTGLYFFCRSG